MTDALSLALRDMRSTGALFFNAELTAPWGFASPPAANAQDRLAPGTEHLVLFHLVTAGVARARAGDEEVSLAAGDVVVLPHGDAHDLWNGAVQKLTDASALLPRILAGSLEVERGGGGGAATRFVCGYFGCDRSARRLFLAGLPPVFKVNLRADPTGAWIEASLLRMVDEVAAGRAGRAALVAKLAEALVIQTLCSYMEELPAERKGWLAAARDEVVGRALACIHRDSSRGWTLPDLAREAGASRSVLAERFTRFLGQPPLAYLAQWRLDRAARLLETSDQSVLQVALEVGYESEAAFNRAFKREFSLPPGKYRRQRALMPPSARAPRVAATSASVPTPPAR